MTYAALATDLRAGDRVLLADGAVELRVVATGDDVATEVVRGGTIRSRAGVSVPSERLTTPALTDKDRADVPVVLELGVDYVAQSFVRRAQDIETLRSLLGDQPPPIVAKIETRPAIDDFDAILEVVDAVMIARGDLGVELPYEEVPIIQKQLVRRALDRGVPTIVATQMLESMIEAPRPTRAEASDVANAVFDGADAIMLSGETAIGRYPDPRRRGGRPDRAPVRGEGPRASRAGRRRRVGHRRRCAHVCRRRPGPRGTGPGRDRLLHAERVDGTHARFAPTAGADLRVRPERIGGQPARPRARRASALLRVE